MAKKNIPIDNWLNEDSNNYFKCDGKLITVDFDRALKTNSNLNVFYIMKDIYVNSSDLIVKYINYFITYYDEDNELIMSYFKLKYMIDNKEKFKKFKEKAFIKSMYDVLFTKSMIEKIKRFTEDNYQEDLISSDPTKKYNKSLEITHEHARILLMISTSIKIMIPIIMHYNNSRKIKKPILFKYFEDLFSIFDKDINIYNKLYIIIKTRVMRNYDSDALMWEKKEILDGADPSEFIDIVLKERIVNDSMFKYRFDMSVHSLNIAIIKRQLSYFTKSKYEYMPKLISYEKDSEGLSSIDKIVMNMSKLDESLIVLSEINIKNTIKKIKKRFNVDVSNEEIDFYIKYHKRSKFQTELVNAYYAKFFDGYSDLFMLTKRQYIELLIILKKKLTYDGDRYLPQLLSGNIDKFKSRTIKNFKFIEKLETDALYIELMNSLYKAIEELKGTNIIIDILSTLINTKFTFVDFDLEDYMGETIEISSNILSGEFLKFLSEI